MGRFRDSIKVLVLDSRVQKLHDRICPLANLAHGLPDTDRAL